MEWKLLIIDIVKLIPSWCPGGGFKRKAAVAGKFVRELYDTPYNMVRDNMVTHSFEFAQYNVFIVSFNCREQGLPGRHSRRIS